jgi:hypothetical protein
VVVVAVRGVGLEYSVMGPQRWRCNAFDSGSDGRTSYSTTHTYERTLILCRRRGCIV